MAPKSSTWMSWHTCMTSLTSCSTSSTAMPSAARDRSRSAKLSDSASSSPEAGSSRRLTRGGVERRSEERRVGDEGVSTSRSRWGEDNKKKKTRETDSERHMKYKKV